MKENYVIVGYYTWRFIKSAVTATIFFHAAFSFAPPAVAEGDSNEEVGSTQAVHRSMMVSTNEIIPVVGWGVSTGQAIQISGATSFGIDRAGVMRIPEPYGKETYISITQNGSVTIREEKFNNVINVAPGAAGGLRIQSPDGVIVTVSENGTVYSTGVRKKVGRTGVNVTVSRDGKTATIWQRGGRLYTVPIPNQQ